MPKRKSGRQGNGPLIFAGVCGVIIGAALSSGFAQFKINWPEELTAEQPANKAQPPQQSVMAAAYKAIVTPDPEKPTFPPAPAATVTPVPTSALTPTETTAPLPTPEKTPEEIARDTLLVYPASAVPGDIFFTGGKAYTLLRVLKILTYDFTLFTIDKCYIL